MSKYILSIFPLIVIIITFWKSTVSKKGCFNESMWTPSQTCVLRAMSILFIVLHHISQDVAGYSNYSFGPISFLSNMGYLFTAVFLFLSGYGLLINVCTREDYLKGFLSHRLLSVLIPFWIVNAINILVGILHFKRVYTPLDIVKYISGLLLINSQGWFVIEIVFLYIVFFILFKFIKNKDVSLSLLGVFSILLIIYSKSLGHDEMGGNTHWFMGEWWYNTTICFWFGALIGRFKEKVASFIKKQYVVVLCVSIVGLILACIFAERMRLTYGYYEVQYIINGFDSALATLLAQILAALSFVWFLIVLNAKIKFNSKLAGKISTISFEIYLIHGLFVRELFDFKNVPNFFRYIIVIACSLVSAFIIYKFNSVVFKVFGYLKKFIQHRTPKKVESRDIRKKKRFFYIKLFVAICISVVVLAISYKLFVTYYVIPKEYEAECEALADAKTLDHVYFGRYGNERVSWIVLQRDENSLMLLSEYGIDGATYYSNHKPVTWQDSDIREYLNNDIYYSMFNELERKHIIDENQDYVSLLTVSEANVYFNNDLERQLLITNYARLMGTNLNLASKMNQWDYESVKTSWWWLRQDENVSSLTAPIVTVDGEILTDTKYVNKPNGAVRPVIWVSLL